MTFDAQELFANLAEKEKVKGHHSPEGRALRTLSRALSGWSGKNLSAHDVIVLSDQAVEDWLKARLKRSPWSVDAVPALLPDAADHDLVTGAEVDRLREIHDLRARFGEEPEIAAEKIEAALEFCIHLIEKRW